MLKKEKKKKKGGGITGFCPHVPVIYKGLLPKQHIKYKTKKLLNPIKLHIHVWNAYLPDDIWYAEVVHFKYDFISNINQNTWFNKNFIIPFRRKKNVSFYFDIML